MRPSKSSKSAAVFALCSIAMLLTACSSTNSEVVEPTNSEVRGPQTLREWRFKDGSEEEGRTLRVTVPTCHGDPEATVEQTQASVTITVISTKYDPGDDCLDSVYISLDEPLGDRSVIDGTTGKAF